MSDITIIGEIVGFTAGLALTVLFAILALRVDEFPGTRVTSGFLALCSFALNGGGLANALAVLSGAATEEQPLLLATAIKLTGATAWSVPMLAIWRQSAAFRWQRIGCRILQVIALVAAAVIMVCFATNFVNVGVVVPIDATKNFFMQFFAFYSTGLVLFALTLLLRRPALSRATSLSYALILSGLAGVTLSFLLHVAFEVEEGVFHSVAKLTGKLSPLVILLGSLFLFARFRFADRFIRYSLSILAASMLAAGLVLLLEYPLAGRWLESTTFPVAARVTAGSFLAAGVLLGFIFVDRGLGLLVNHWIFRAPDYQVSTQQLGEKLLHLHQETEIVAAVEKSARTQLEIEGASMVPLAQVPPRWSRAELETSDVIAIECADRRRHGFSLPHVELLVVVRVGGQVSHVFVVAPGRARRALVTHEVNFLRALASQFAARLESLRVEREMVERRSRESKLLQQITEAELRALRAQINPHFLFNSLNTIADLIVTDPARAEMMTLRLSQVFRHVLAHSARSLTSVQEEIDFVRTYLYIEETRFGDRLHVEIDVTPEAAPMLIPSLILQPLVENALKHGLAPKPGAVRLWISASADRGRVRLTVEDDGVGLLAGAVGKRNGRARPLATARAAGSGVGLKNVTERLHTLYQDRAGVSLESRVAGGSCATLDIPFANNGHAA